MEIIQGYSSSEESEENLTSNKNTNKNTNKNNHNTLNKITNEIKVLAAPDTAVEDSMEIALIKSNLVNEMQMTMNIPYEEMTKPIQGPINPFNNSNSNSNKLKRKNMLTGYAENEVFDNNVFKDQRLTFQNLGYAKNPEISSNLNSEKFIGDKSALSFYKNQSIRELKPDKLIIKNLKSKRYKKGDPSIFDGPKAYKGPWAKYKNSTNDSSNSESEESESEESEDELNNELINSSSNNNNNTNTNTNTNNNETTIFHGDSMYDYAGRSYMHIPQDLGINLLKEPGEQECFIPNKKIHTWKGHENGVSAIQFFPRSGHLLISAGMDTKVKLWDVYHNRKLLRTFNGHKKAVKDVSFSANGDRFLTASYDKMMKLWDTETGKCISRFTTGKTPNVIRFNPESDKSNQFIAGMMDNKIVQFDINSGELIQEYDHHLGAVNTITFVDDNRRFMTSSDDKSIRVWEWQINVPIKFIADPTQHSMPAITLHPSGNYVAAQSMDNKIYVFGAKGKFRQNKKKVFTGHNCAGYRIQLDFSPDGQYLMSGDTTGNAFFWDWKTTKLRSHFHAHNGPLTCIAAHPQETSKVATAGFDGPIHFWD